MTQHNPVARILLVEDDTTARVSLTQVLERVNYIVEAVADGETAIARLSDPVWSRSISVVITDLLLRETDGIGVLRYARQLDDPPEVVLLTGYGTLQTAIESLRSGVSDYLLKPCKPEELLRSVAQAVHRCQSRRAERMAVRSIAEGLAHLHNGPAPSTANAQADHPLVPGQLVQIGELLIDRYAHLVSCAGRIVPLTPTEYALLVSLAEANGAMVSYSKLAQATYGRVVEPHLAHQLLKTHIYNLRHKLGPAYIVNVRSAGYRLVNPADAASA